MKTTTMYCTLLHGERGDYYWHFYPNAFCVKLCGVKPADVLKVQVTETPEEPKCYWGWWDAKREAFVFVYYAKGMVDMCFPYGAKAEEERGKGKMLPVKVEILSEEGKSTDSKLLEVPR